MNAECGMMSEKQRPCSSIHHSAFRIHHSSLLLSNLFTRVRLSHENKGLTLVQEEKIENENFPPAQFPDYPAGPLPSFGDINFYRKLSPKTKTDAAEKNFNG